MGRGEFFQNVNQMERKETEKGQLRKVEMEVGVVVDIYG